MEGLIFGILGIPIVSRELQSELSEFIIFMAVFHKSTEIFIALTSNNNHNIIIIIYNNYYKEEETSFNAISYLKSPQYSIRKIIKHQNNQVNIYLVIHHQTSRSLQNFHLIPILYFYRGVNNHEAHFLASLKGRKHNTHLHFGKNSLN